MRPTEQLATILLVEDNQDDIFIMRRVFKKAHIKSPLQVVTDGKEAVSFLEGSGAYTDRKRHPLPYLVFLDLKLPFLHGFDVLEWIREQPNLQTLRVIILSSSMEDKDREKAHAFGAMYLVKPPTTDLLHKAIRQLGLE